jgi:hypothetical protein
MTQVLHTQVLTFHTNLKDAGSLDDMIRLHNEQYVDMKFLN